MEMRLKSAEVKHNEDKLQLHKRHEMAMKQACHFCAVLLLNLYRHRFWIARMKSWKTPGQIIVYKYRDWRRWLKGMREEVSNMVGNWQ